MDPNGEWVVSRSDGFELSILHPHVPVIFGRGFMLPPGQRIDHMYISRRHFSIEWRPPFLFARQLGKNPTFYSADFLLLPGGGGDSDDGDNTQELQFRLQNDGEEGGDTRKCSNNVLFLSPVRDRTHRFVVNNTVENIGASTLHFPEELRLPMFTVRYLAPCLMAEQATLEGIPRILSGWLDHAEVEEDEDDDEAKAGEVGCSVKPYARCGWKGILDTILLGEIAQQQEGGKNGQQNVASPLQGKR